MLGSGELSAAPEAKAETVIVLENDLSRRGLPEQVAAILGGAKHVISLDFMDHATTRASQAVLPAGSFAESDGTFINYEGRAQRFFQVIAPAGAVQESWRWLRDLMIAAGHLPADAWSGLDEVLADLGIEHPALMGVREAAPPASEMKWARSSRRFSGRTSILANISVHEPKPPGDPDAPLTFTMEGNAAPPPPPLLSRYWAAGWNSVQSLNQLQQEVGGPLRDGDPGVLLLKPDGEALWHACPPPPGPPQDGLLAVPLHHIFGSEELSNHSAAIAERSSRPYLAMNAAEAAKRDLRGEVHFTIGTTDYRLPLHIVPELPDGVAGFPAGFPETGGIVPNTIIPI